MSDTISDKLSEQGLLNAVNEAIAKLQEACTQFANTMQSLTDHESSEEAHPDIRELITDVVDATGFLLKTDANTLIAQMINNHDESTTAHASILTTIQNLTTSMNTLKNRLDVLDPQDPTDPETELARRLKEVNDSFDPVLQYLQSAWMAAVMLNTGNADAIALEYSNTAAMKAAAIAAVMEEFEYVS